MNIQWLQFHILGFEAFGQILHWLIVQFRFCKAERFYIWEDWSQDQNWVRAEVVVTEIEVYQLHEFRIIQSCKVWEAIGCKRIKT